MKNLLLALAAALVASVLAAPTAAQARDVDKIELGGVSVKVGDRTKQVVTVNRRTRWHATLALWRRTDDGWKRRLVAEDGRIGYNGLVPAQKRRQGSGKTPSGTFKLLWAFGSHPRNDAWDLRYRKMRRGDYWVGDNRSDPYNRCRTRAAGGFRWRLPSSNYNASERLLDYKQAYEYSLVTSFNRNQVRHRGFAIFLHVNGSGATAGCVSGRRWFLKALMRRLDPDLRPRIAIGR